MKPIVLSLTLFAISAMAITENAFAQKRQVEVKVSQESSISLNKAIDLHLTEKQNPLKGTVNLIAEDAWLFFDNLRPSEVISKYKKSIFINDKPLKVGKGGNSRVEIYKHGAVIIPLPEEYKPLEIFTEKGYKGKAEQFSVGNYYTNKPDREIPETLVKPLTQDNSIQSFKLKRGYMATLATEPNGMGYSRIFIADTADITLAEIPAELNQKISFIRIFKWRWPSKKGWCGVRNEQAIVQANGKIRQDYELELTQSTWVYSWGLNDPYFIDCEFVPMKWGYGGSFDKVNSRTDVTHLLGYNEPNRPDQANISVEKALEEWPKLMSSGLRLGSPSVSDNSKLNEWLYKFMDECKKHNYRVDYVAVHGYWGPDQMRDPKAWLDCLREIHQRTGRPIWLTEWNIGANWTKEPWPSEQKAQFEKQRNNLKGVLEVLDNAPFIERYSIYNWVEDKRAMIIDSYSYKEENGKKVYDKLMNQTITPAGEFYRDNHPTCAYNPKMEFISSWKYSQAPILTYSLSERNEIQLFWNLANCPKELVGGYAVERSMDGVNFNEIHRLNANEKPLFFESLPNKTNLKGDLVTYRIQVLDMNFKKVLASNSISYTYLPNSVDNIFVTNLLTPTHWKMYAFEQPYNTTPFILFGTSTNRNKTPQTKSARNINNAAFDLKLSQWKYLNDRNFSQNDTLSCMIIPSGQVTKLKGLDVQNETVTLTNEMEITFKQPFKEVPVIFVSPCTNNNEAPNSIRISDVTEKGFIVRLQYEADVTSQTREETINYLAIVPGEGSIHGKKVEIGRTVANSVGEYFNSTKIEFKNSYQNAAFFSSMQSTNDDIASELRIKKRGNKFVEIFKEKEKSKGNIPSSSETVGWMIVEL